MAKILNGHFGSYQGKLGAVTGIKRKGIFYIRQSVTHNGSNTKAQASQRLLFSKVMPVFSAFAQAAKFGFGDGDGLTSLNAFVKFNWRNVVPDTQAINIKDISVARGAYINVSNPTISAPDTGKLSAGWRDDSATDDRIDSNDKVFVVAYEQTNNATIVVQALRKDATIEFGYPASWRGKDAHTWIFTVSKRNGKVCDSAYVGLVSCE